MTTVLLPDADEGGGQIRDSSSSLESSSNKQEIDRRHRPTVDPPRLLRRHPKTNAANKESRNESNLKHKIAQQQSSKPVEQDSKTKANRDKGITMIVTKKNGQPKR